MSGGNKCYEKGIESEAVSGWVWRVDRLAWDIEQNLEGEEAVMEEYPFQQREWQDLGFSSTVCSECSEVIIEATVARAGAERERMVRDKLRNGPGSQVRWVVRPL